MKKNIFIVLLVFAFGLFACKESRIHTVPKDLRIVAGKPRKHTQKPPDTASIAAQQESEQDTTAADSSTTENVQVSEEDYNLDEVIQKHLEASGASKLARMKSMTVKGILTQGGMDMPLVTYVMRPGKSRLELKVQNNMMVQVYDGKEGWMLAQWLGPNPREATGDELERMKDRAEMDGTFYKAKKSKNYKIEADGREVVDGKNNYKIKITKGKSNISYHFIDPDTYLVTKVKTTIKAQGQELEVESLQSKYKSVSGIKQAFEIEQKIKGQTFTKIKITDIKFNEEYPDSLFVKPGK